MNNSIKSIILPLLMTVLSSTALNAQILFDVTEYTATTLTFSFTGTFAGAPVSNDYQIWIESPGNDWILGPSLEVSGDPFYPSTSGNTANLFTSGTGLSDATVMNDESFLTAQRPDYISFYSSDYGSLAGREGNGLSMTITLSGPYTFNTSVNSLSLYWGLTSEGFSEDPAPFGVFQSTATVPEPAQTVGLISVGALLMTVSRRRK